MFCLECYEFLVPQFSQIYVDWVFNYGYNILYYRSCLCSGYRWRPCYSFTDCSILILLRFPSSIYFSDYASRFLVQLDHFQYMIICIWIAFIQIKFRDTRNGYPEIHYNRNELVKLFGESCMFIWPKIYATS
jgi:hypothetical protein